MASLHQILSEINTDKDEILIENNAQTIFDHISELEKDRVNNEKRWFWELLQNAKDSVDIQESVSIRVSMAGSKLTFAHTGKPFQRKDILHLIFHGSSKKKAEGKVGRFGTGFMTTHLLSKTVQIKGALAEGGFFDFSLDRDAIDAEDEKRKLETSYRSFTESITDASFFFDEFQTQFTYDLNKGSLSDEIAENGLNQLPNILPFVLAFNDKIKSIVMDGFTISKAGEAEKIVSEESEFWRHQIQVGNDQVVYPLVHSNTEYDFGILLEKPKSNDIFKIKKLSNSYPKLFFDFPLFGTERLGIPFVVNSLSFDPRKERDGIFLVEIPDQKSTHAGKIAKNREILEKAFSTYLVAVKLLAASGTTQLENLCDFKPPQETTWLDAPWLTGLMKKCLELLLSSSAKLLKVDGIEKTISFADIKIPFIARQSDINSFHSFILTAYPDTTIDVKEYEIWMEILWQISQILQVEVESHDFIITKEKICKLFDAWGTLSDASNQKGTSPDLVVTNWVNDFLSYLDKDELIKFSSQYRLIPNQHDMFVRNAFEVLKVDGDIDATLKEISELYEWDLRSILIHRQISSVNKHFDSMTNSRVLNNLEEINRKTPRDELSKSRREAFIKHLKFLIVSRLENFIKEIHVFVSEKVDNQITLEARLLFSDDSKRLLAPMAFWSDTFGLYGDLVREKFVLHDEYASLLNRNEIGYLASLGFIYPEPLIIRKKRATKNDLKYLLRSYDDISRLTDEKGELKFYEVEVSDIAYLVTTDDHILSKTGNSFKSASNLLKFILMQVINNDKLFGSDGVLDQVKYLKCMWIGRLRDTQWVPVKSNDDERTTLLTERPTTANLTTLISRDSEILGLLRTQQSAVFLNELGISVTDIFRNTISDLQQKLLWDITFSKLLMNKKIDPALAQEMLEDPLLQDVYETKKRERERIKANQNIGYLFEKVFKEIFESPEFKNVGFKIERKAIGSDYEIAYENDVVDDNNRQIQFEVGDIIIELKATGKEYAEMTPTQVDRAYKVPKNYVLAILPLGNYAITKENVRQHSKFVINISEFIKEKHTQYVTYSDQKNFLTVDDTEVAIHIEDGTTRFRVKSPVWDNGSLEFDSFVKWMKEPKQKK